MLVPEREFLIKRALNVFNRKYGRDVKVEDCDIYSIPIDIHSDRAYEIITPEASEFFRIRFYFKFGNMDREGNVRLEVSMPFGQGELGDEVYIVRSEIDKYWHSVNMYRFDHIVSKHVPMGVITTEAGEPILTEQGLFIVAEGY